MTSFQKFVLHMLKFLLHISCSQTRYFRQWIGASVAATGLDQWKTNLVLGVGPTGESCTATTTLTIDDRVRFIGPASLCDSAAVSGRPQSSLHQSAKLTCVSRTSDQSIDRPSQTSLRDTGVFPSVYEWHVCARVRCSGDSVGVFETLRDCSVSCSEVRSQSQLHIAGGALRCRARHCACRNFMLTFAKYMQENSWRWWYMCQLLLLFDIFVLSKPKNANRLHLCPYTTEANTISFTLFVVWRQHGWHPDLLKKGGTSKKTNTNRWTSASSI